MQKRESSFHVGIDLGTTNTVMATCKPSKKAFFRPNVRDIYQDLFATQMGMSSSLPSVLFFDTEGKAKVGEYASIRRKMGQAAGFSTIPR